MTQPRRQDEHLLDYLYEELDAKEHAAFEAKLSEDAALRAEVESLKQVRREFRQLPRVEPSPESAQRMAALLMQQAAQAHGKRDMKGAAASRGKLIPLGKPGRFRITSWPSPAAGIFAAAAAALFWVVLKSREPDPGSSLHQAVEFDRSLSQVAKADHRTLAAEQNMPFPSPPARIPIKKAFDDALNGSAPAKDTAKDATMAAASTAAKAPPTVIAMAARDGGKGARVNSHAGKDTLGSLLDSANSDKPSAKKPMVVAQLLPAPVRGALDDSYEKPRVAPPPPPPPEVAAGGAGAEAELAERDGVREQMKKTQAHRKERIVEELADQALAGMPAPPARAAASAAAAAPLPQAAPASKELATAQEQLQRGRCAEAHATLQRLEQTFPAMQGLGETRTQWQRSCQMPNQLQASQPAPQKVDPETLLKEGEASAASSVLPASPPASSVSKVASPAPLRAKKAASPPPKAKAEGSAVTY